MTAFEAVSAFSSDEVVRQAAANWDAGIDFDPVGLENGGWPVWIVAAAVLMWAARRIWVCHVLHGNAPIVVEVLEPNTSPAIPARDALVAAVGEIGLVRPSAAPGVAGDETVKTLDAVSAVVPTARPFITVVQEVFRAVRRQARYSVTLVHNPSGNTGTGSEGPLALVVQINAQPIGSPVLFRSVTGQDATSVGRSAAFDVGCAVLNRSRDVPAWAAWPPGTGEALDLYVLAMREARLPGSASDLRARTMEREKRRTLLRQAHRHAPGNGLIRHELARLEFQLGNSVVAAILLAQNAAVYPDFTESRYRYAVTLLMMSGDPATMWFEAPRGSRATCCDLVDPGLRSEQPDVFRHLTARRPHPVATRLCRDWLLEHSQFLLRDGRKFGWLAAVRAWVLEGREWSVSRQLHRTAQTAANGTEVIKKILALVDAGQQRTASESLFDALRGELQASKRDSWQVLYNKACCAARVYGIAAAEGWPRNDGWAKIAVDLLRDAITHPTFALARWSENASELVVHLDPDLEPLRSHPYFSSLTGMLTLSGAEERPKEA